MQKALLILASAALLSAAAVAQKTPITITADLTDGARKLYHAEIDMPVTAGKLEVTTPLWIPGTHAPNGPLSDITGLVFTANGQVLPWRRDDVQLSAFHLTVPKGVTTLHVHLDCVVNGRVTDNMAVLEWEKLLLYPDHIPVKDIAIQPSVTVPAGWGIGTALLPISPYDPQHPAGGTVHYAATTVEQLEDSPIITGEYFHEFALAPEIKPAHFIDVISGEPDHQMLRPETLAEINNLVREADAMYKSHHYLQYHFLLTLSDLAGGEGLEHGQSSDNGIGELGFADDRHQLGNADLLAHEFTHSWNGKYRRPDGLATPDFATPQQGQLLWVYEGMTQYLGNVLAARAGLKTQEQYRDILAASAASLDFKPGRTWRDTEDTAIGSSFSRRPGPAWANWKRGQDYYQEGELLWLDADTLIRKMTDNKKSLNNFEAIFLGKGGNTGPLIAPYNVEEVARDLNEVVKYDWADFLHSRITSLSPHANLAGIEQGGYKLVYLDHPSASEKTASAIPRNGAAAPLNAWYSLGLRVAGDGTIADVRWGGPADKARVAPVEKIIGVNGHVYSGDALRDAIKKARTDTAPIHLILQSESNLKMADIDYHEGEKFPSLERVDGTPAYLDDITKSLTTPPAK